MLSDRLIGICAGDVIASKKNVDIFVGALLAAGAQLVGDGSWEEVDVWRHQDLPQIPHTQLDAFKSDNLRHSQICETFLQHFVLSTEYMWVMEIGCNG